MTDRSAKTGSPATLSTQGKTYDFPIMEGTLGPLGLGSQ